MKGEIDNDFYCSAESYDGYGKCDVSMLDTENDGDDLCHPFCKNYHRKYPTPEQYKKEYGEEYPDDGAVYSLQQRMQKDSIFDKEPVPKWTAMSYEHYKENLKGYRSGLLGVFILDVVCACTPFGKPDDTWRPE